MFCLHYAVAGALSRHPIPGVIVVGLSGPVLENGADRYPISAGSSKNSATTGPVRQAFGTRHRVPRTGVPCTDDLFQPPNNHLQPSVMQAATSKTAKLSDAHRPTTSTASKRQIARCCCPVPPPSSLQMLCRPITQAHSETALCSADKAASPLFENLPPPTEKVTPAGASIQAQQNTSSGRPRPLHEGPRVSIVGVLARGQCVLQSGPTPTAEPRRCPRRCPTSRSGRPTQRCTGSQQKPQQGVPQRRRDRSIRHFRQLLKSDLKYD